MSYEIFDHLCFYHIFVFYQLSCISFNFYSKWWSNINYWCDYEYFPWCQITTHPLEISTFTTSSIPRWLHISVIFNDKLKIPPDFNSESQGLSKDNRIFKFGFKMTEIEHICRTLHFIISPNDVIREKEM